MLIFDINPKYLQYLFITLQYLCNFQRYLHNFFNPPTNIVNPNILTLLGKFYNFLFNKILFFLKFITLFFIFLYLFCIHFYFLYLSFYFSFENGVLYLVLYSWKLYFLNVWAWLWSLAYCAHYWRNLLKGALLTNLSLGLLTIINHILGLAWRIVCFLLIFFSLSKIWAQGY